MAKKKVTISEEQLLITDKGEIIKAKELLSSKHKLIQWKEKYSSADIMKVQPSFSNLLTIGGAQGRTIKCTPATRFLGDSSAIDIDNIKNILVTRHLPIFGSKKLTSKDIDYLAFSLRYMQGKRPNKYIKHTIPLMLSKLDEQTLSKIILSIFSDGKIQHLDQRSKDLLIILLSRLGFQFDGQTKHVATNITGTLSLLDVESNIAKNPTKKENIRYIDTCKDDAIDIIFKDVDYAVIGSFICQTN